MPRRNLPRETVRRFLKDVQAGNIAAVQKGLTAFPALAQAQDEDGWTPFAVMKKQDEIAGLLIEAGACIDAAECSGVTPLMFAMSGAAAPMVEILLSQEADLSRTDRSGQTALMYAVEGGDVECVRLLLAKGADVRQASNNGETAIFYMRGNEAGSRNREVLRLLIDHGADVTKRNEEGDTAADALRRCGEGELADFIDSCAFEKAFANGLRRSIPVSGPLRLRLRPGFGA